MLFENQSKLTQGLMIFRMLLDLAKHINWRKIIQLQFCFLECNYMCETKLGNPELNNVHTRQPETATSFNEIQISIK